MVEFPFVWTNGEVHERSIERASSGGDELGVIETFLWQRDSFRCAGLHQQRLERGLTLVKRQAPLAVSMQAVARALCAANRVTEAVVRIEVTAQDIRGSLRERPPAGSMAVFLGATALPEETYPTGSKTTRRDTYEQALALARGAGMDEALLLDGTGGVAEGSFSNVFAVLEEGLVTPDLGGGGVAGICREWLLGGPDPILRASHLAPASLFQASEVILTNALRGPLGVRRLGSQERLRDDLPGARGPVCRAWARRWQALLPET